MENLEFIDETPESIVTLDPFRIEPIVVPGFLDPEIYGAVYDAVDGQINQNLEKGDDPYAEPFVRAGSNGFIILFECVKPEVYDYLQKKISEAIGMPVRKPGLLFARYSHESGYAPRLLPHADRAMKNPAVTMTVELDSTLDWDIYVEDTRYKLERNDAIFFSGSHQTHFRPHQEFSKDDYYDILLIQTTLDLPDQKELTEENHFREMDGRSGQYIQKYHDIMAGAFDDRGDLHN